MTGWVDIVDCRPMLALVAQSRRAMFTVSAETASGRRYVYCKNMQKGSARNLAKKVNKTGSIKSDLWIELTPAADSPAALADMALSDTANTLFGYRKMPRTRECKE